jgi:hypothetical protein
VDIAGDLVFLDVSADAYLCLVEGGEHLTLGPEGVVESSPEAALDLIEAGLLVVSGPNGERSEIRRPARSLAPLGRWSGPKQIWEALLVNRTAASAVRHLTFSDVLALAAACNPHRKVDSRAVVSASRGFDRLAPWLPHDGVCLMRSLQQRLWLARQGLHADWVFGVRTWPFEAHCWLQAGDVVLDDTFDHASGFVPIMVV